MGQFSTLAPEKKIDWNNFVDFLDKSGYRGNVQLDDRDKSMGHQLLEKFNALNPNSKLKYEDVPAIQTELQNYRTNLVNRWKAGKAQSDAKSEDEIMPGLSAVDGWLGSKTSSYKFPTAVVVSGKDTVQNFGVNTDLYDKFMDARKQMNSNVIANKNK